MASTIAAGTTSGTAIAIAGDTSGVLQLQTNGTTAAVTIGTDQRAAFVAGTALLPAITTTGDLNTGMYFSAADTVDIATGGTAAAQLDSSQNFKFNSGYGSVATAYGCRAWVNFNGTGTPAIRASGNVTSITDNGTGDYTVNFTNAMPNTNYAVSGSARQDDNGVAGTMRVVSICAVGTLANAMQTTSVRIATQYANSAIGNDDVQVACVQIFR
jgi:hypothetical protein